MDKVVESVHWQWGEVNANDNAVQKTSDVAHVPVIINNRCA